MATPSRPQTRFEHREEAVARNVARPGPEFAVAPVVVEGLAEGALLVLTHRDVGLAVPAEDLARLVDHHRGVESPARTRIVLEDRGDENQAGVARGLAQRRHGRSGQCVLGQAEPHRVATQGEVRAGEQLAHPQDLRARRGSGPGQVDVMRHVRGTDGLETIAEDR